MTYRGHCRKSTEKKCAAKPCVLLTKSTEYSPCGEASTCSGSQKYSSILWNPKIHYRLHTNPPLVPVVRHLNPIHPLPPRFLPSKQRSLRSPSTGRKKVHNHPITNHELRCTSNLIAKWGGWSTPRAGRLIPGI